MQQPPAVERRYPVLGNVNVPDTMLKNGDAHNDNKLINSDVILE